MKLTLMTLAFLSLAIPALAAESDHYTRRDEKLEDITEWLNFRANMYIEKAVNDANVNGEACDLYGAEEDLYRELRKYFGNHSNGELAKDVLYAPSVPKRIIPLTESVYQNWRPWTGYILGTRKRTHNPLALSPMIKVAGHLIGADKLEHMFGSGFMYFKAYYLRNEDLDSILQWGAFKERTILGGSFFTTGVFSYADLAANFNGMRLWNHFLLKRPDILGQNQGPYVVCQDRKWVISKESSLDFAHYIDHSLDESVNCSKFATPGGAKKFQASLKRLGYAETHPQGQCPLEPQKFEMIRKKYDVKPARAGMAAIAEYILNFSGNEEVRGWVPIEANR